MQSLGLDIRVLRDDNTEVEIMETVDYGETDFRRVMEGDIYDRRKEEEDLESMGFAKQEFVGEELKDIEDSSDEALADEFAMSFDEEEDN